MEFSLYITCPNPGCQKTSSACKNPRQRYHRKQDCKSSYLSELILTENFQIYCKTCENKHHISQWQFWCDCPITGDAQYTYTNIDAFRLSLSYISQILIKENVDAYRAKLAMQALLRMLANA